MSNEMRQKENNFDVANQKSYPASAPRLFEWPHSSARALLRHVPAEEIPPAEDLHTTESLQQHLDALREPPYSVIVAGDIMLGGRAKSSIIEQGADYPFAAVLPLLRQSAIVVGNL